MNWSTIIREFELSPSSRLICLHGPTSPQAIDLQSLRNELNKRLNKPSSKVVLMPTRAQYINNHSHQGLFFQQRYQASYSDQGETVRQRLEKPDMEVSESEREWLINEFELALLFDKPLLQLSSGEWQRFSICEAVLMHPEVLIVIDLIKGLDQRWQTKILHLLNRVMKPEKRVIFTSDRSIDHPAVYNILVDDKIEPRRALPDLNPLLIEQMYQYQSSFLLDTSERNQIKMTGVNIQYGNRKILEDVYWTVRAGDKWNIQGPNGAGKSTLISLVNSDNPQGYSQPIKLFGSDYGQHSIWDRKARISYFGSDFFQYFKSSKSVLDTLLQQLKTPYLNTIQPPESLVLELMSWFGISDYRHQRYAIASRDTRRQLLLLATYLKSSNILILDEPYQDFSEDRILQNNLFLNYLQPQSPQTVIFVTHRDDHKPQFLNRMLGLDKGRVTQK